MTALERVRELDQQKAAILQKATEEILAKASEAIKELKALVQERLKECIPLLGDLESSIVTSGGLNFICDAYFRAS